MTKDERIVLLGELVNEITLDNINVELVKELTHKLGIPYTEDPMQLLNNVLKGIHSEGPINESNP